MGRHLQKPLKNVRFRPFSAPVPWNAFPMKCLNVSTIYLGNAYFIGAKPISPGSVSNFYPPQAG